MSTVDFTTVNRLGDANMRSLFYGRLRKCWRREKFNYAEQKSILRSAKELLDRYIRIKFQHTGHVIVSSMSTDEDIDLFSTTCLCIVLKWVMEFDCRCNELKDMAPCTSFNARTLKYTEKLILLAFDYNIFRYMPEPKELTQIPVVTIKTEAPIPPHLAPTKIEAPADVHPVECMCKPCTERVLDTFEKYFVTIYKSESQFSAKMTEIMNEFGSSLGKEAKLNLFYKMLVFTMANLKALKAGKYNNFFKTFHTKALEFTQVNYDDCRALTKKKALFIHYLVSHNIPKYVIV
jgi:hypothetical protein